MGQYDYYEAVADSIRDYITENINFDDFDSEEQLTEYLNDTLRTEDSVTGNGSGSYFFNRYEAEEALCHNLDLLAEALENFGDDNYEKYLNNPEAADVTIRCYLLRQCIDCAVDCALDDADYDFDTRELEEA